MLTKSAYEMLAATLYRSEAKANAAWGTIVAEIAETLARDNPRFQPGKFMTACGVTPIDYRKSPIDGQYFDRRAGRTA